MDLRAPRPVVGAANTLSSTRTVLPLIVTAPQSFDFALKEHRLPGGTKTTTRKLSPKYLTLEET